MFAQRVRFAGMAVVATVHLIGAVAFAQLALLPDDMETAFGLQVIAGDVQVPSLLTEKTAVVFFMLEDCPACEEFFAFEPFRESTPVPFVLVTNAPASDVLAWVRAHPGWNVWLDPLDEFAMLLSVTTAPSVYMVDAGAVVNADYWPFTDGLARLYADLEYFAYAPASPRAEDVVQGLLGVDVSQTLPSSLLTAAEEQVSSDEQTVVLVCWPTCSVCLDSVEQFDVWYRENPDLPPLLLISVADEDSHGASENAFAAWAEAGFPVHEISRSNAGPLDLPLSPVTLLVDPNGKVMWASVGFSPNLNERILQQLGGFN